jgi:hypothetical protein
LNKVRPFVFGIFKKMFSQRSLLFLVALLFLMIPSFGYAQESWEELAHSRSQINQTGMQVLLGWSVLNMAGGTLGYFQTRGKNRYFHQMNAIWNVVNAGIAVGALSGMGSDSLQSLPMAYKEGLTMEKVLLANAGLDVAYMAAGGYLVERGLRKDKTRFRGWGQSLILQGGFLLALDTVLFILNNNQNQELYKLLSHVSVNQQGIGLAFHF